MIGERNPSAIGLDARSTRLNPGGAIGGTSGVPPCITRAHFSSLLFIPQYVQWVLDHLCLNITIGAKHVFHLDHISLHLAT